VKSIVQNFIWYLEIAGTRENNCTKRYLEPVK
jgi:hypothetical protein